MLVGWTGVKAAWSRWKQLPGLVIECEVRNALKQVGLARTEWFALRCVLEDVTRVCAYSDGFDQPLVCSVNHLYQHYLGSDHIAEGRKQACSGGIRWLDNYRPIKLLNIELNILDRILANCLQVGAKDLIELEKIYTVKGRSIQNNLHLVCETIEDDTNAELISLDQSKNFDRMAYQFLAAVLETERFKLEFKKCISMLYHNSKSEGTWE